MKLRLLNAGHTATVYLASLLGYQKIDEAMEDPLIRNHTIQYMNSVT